MAKLKVKGKEFILRYRDCRDIDTSSKFCRSVTLKKNHLVYITRSGIKLKLPLKGLVILNIDLIMMIRGRV